jgi:hypothetical protein
LIAEVQKDKSISASFDLAIADEAHRCAGKSDAGFSTILDAAKIRSAKRLFTTATPRYFGKAVKDAAKLRDTEIIGMDNEELFGPVIHKLTFGEAIQRDLLNDYQVVVVGVDEPRVKLLIDNYELVSSNPDNMTDARTLAAKVGLIKAIRDYNLKRVISFHSRVKGAKEFSGEFKDVVELIKPVERPEGLFFADYVEGKMKASDRADKIQQLKSLEGYDRGVLSNARCLAEGVDVPSLDGIAFIDPRGSQIEIIQAVGRAIRKVRNATSQSKGTIVIPVFIEEGDSPEASIEASNFKPVWDVLNALRAHDEILAETLDGYRRSLARGSHRSEANVGKIIFELPSNVGAEFASALRTIVVEASSASWEFWFTKLQQYKEQYSDTLVPAAFKTHDDYRLGQWVDKQRHRRKILSDDRVDRLNSIGFVWNLPDALWEKGFEKLQQYWRENTNCLVSRKFITDDGYRLGQWVGVQRQRRKILSDDRVDRLNSIGFVWDRLSERWDSAFAKLMDFKEKNGDCLVPADFKTEYGLALGLWVSSQRLNKAFLSPDRFERLQSIDFVWDPLAQQWQEGFSKLQDFKEKNGDCLVPQGFKTEDGFKLGAWVLSQRQKRASLSPDRVERLEKIGFLWHPNEYLWNTGFAALKRYKNVNGDCLVPQGFKTEDGFKLGAWVGRQMHITKQLTSRPMPTHGHYLVYLHTTVKHP